MSEINGMPRRVHVERRTEMETEIVALISKVEALGAHPLLTDVVDYLDNAFCTLADWEDMQRHMRKRDGAIGG